jgi:hypothetical protein
MSFKNVRTHFEKIGETVRSGFHHFTLFKAKNDDVYGLEITSWTEQKFLDNLCGIYLFTKTNLINFLKAEMKESSIDQLFSQQKSKL